MKKLIKDILSQEVINNFYHLPKAILANIIYGFPTRGLTVIGVTGTDGKTTTVNMIYQILLAAGKKVSVVSTINAPGFHITSPDSFAVQRFARQAASSGDEYLVLEVTSHALDQYRYWGIKFDIGVITNITHEHLDYHKTFDNYLKTKLKLIRNVRFAVVNQNIKDVSSEGKIITFGLDKGDFNQEQIKLKLKVPGDYNIENALTSLAVAFALGIDKKIAQDALESFTGIKGRMEEVQNNKDIKIIIDFAHTPGGLEQALKALRCQMRSGRLIAVIGAEGDRDIEKRFMMGEIAQRFANYVIVTAVDPRGYLDIINRQIADGATKAGAKRDQNFFVIDDREKAFDFAINKLSKYGDTVGIFGKGHETSMNLDGKREIPWSDLEAVRNVLASS
ncbi:hypothetical protein A2867_02445 [Candidatus Daviesbacteria bacterium RIFCSPHIGHO2_01_FULL_40_11]|uniref:UDP-N-acetylmuramoyl-L-alanyl-D-glutamate--2, 6-diaminopimelate ligase n=1 Tax=Candidatus Daviesbacteria bacterium RIFCSPHIGHO2_01_FULL_40_11 TaxID=1797762 RepID=A0A1F5JH01_9BACT|nr:MAG: hypothetical protein A2867_02445 [Candidatus Daviesbacteria bacterium RIFCSPHIGHO2_01_FULL_40_11]